MSRRIRKMVAAILTTAVLLVGAMPAFAYDEPYAYENVSLEARNRETPIFLDALLFRPAGVLLTALGAVAFLPAAMFVGITRPTEIDEPFKLLVVNPFRYTFLDPLGEH